MFIGLNGSKSMLTFFSLPSSVTMVPQYTTKPLGGTVRTKRRYTVLFKYQDLQWKKNSDSVLKKKIKQCLFYKRTRFSNPLDETINLNNNSKQF